MQVANLQEEIDILGSLMANTTVVNCSSVQAPMDSNNGMQYLLQHDATNRTQYYHTQLANFLSQEVSATLCCQGFDSNMDTELPNIAHGLEEPLFGDSNSNPLEKFLSGIDQEGFMNHPWFKHNADIKN